MANELYETQSLKLLENSQTELGNALKWLEGRNSEGIESYCFYTAAHINLVAEGYIYLRMGHRNEASKHLIRTAIEAFFRLQAVRSKPELLFRIAYTESEEDKKWARTLRSENAPIVLQEIDKNWDTFVQIYKEKYPQHSVIENGLPLRDAAKCAGMEFYYDSHYRLYCRFTHAAFRATTGSLRVFEPQDNVTMVIFTLSALEALISLGTPSPNIESLKEQLSALNQD